MLARIRKARENDEGFTLIELLVVIIIIGILAAIAIPTFLKQREKGWEASAKSDLRNASTAQESYFTEATTVGGSTGNYYATTIAQLQGEGFNPSASVVLEFPAGVSPTGTSYIMCAKHSSGGAKFKVDSSTGTVTKLATNTTACA